MSRRYSKKKESILNQIPIFLSKTYQIVDNPEYDKIIAWGEDGDCFVIKDEPALTSQVLPKHFKHNNFSSFVRQLNMYGFTKVRTNQDGHAFKHQYFKKDRMDLLTQIKRKNNTVQQRTGVQDANPSNMIVAVPNKGREQELQREVANLSAKHSDLQNIVSVLIDQNKEIIMQNRQFVMKMNKMDQKYRKKLQALIMMVLFASKGNNTEKGFMIPPQAIKMIKALKQGQSNSFDQGNNKEGTMQLYNNNRRKGKRKSKPSIQELVARVLKSDDQMESGSNFNLGQEYSKDWSEKTPMPDHNFPNLTNSSRNPDEDLQKSFRLLKNNSEDKDHLLNVDLMPPPSPRSINGAFMPPPSPVRSDKDDWSDIFGQIKNDKNQPIRLHED